MNLPTHPNFKNLIGKRFKYLTVLELSHKTNTRYYYICLCDCGNKTIVSSGHLTTNHTQSCGCYHIKQATKHSTKHNKCKSPEYYIWTGLKQRCYNTNNSHYKYYGGNEIRVCDRWLNSFQNFYNDMGNRPSAKHSIDRIDNKENYCPENCRWATISQQVNNKNSNRSFTINGKTMNLFQWAYHFKISPKNVWNRLSLGWSIEKALTQPLRYSKK